VGSASRRRTQHAARAGFPCPGSPVSCSAADDIKLSSTPPIPHNWTVCAAFGKSKEVQANLRRVIVVKFLMQLRRSSRPTHADLEREGARHATPGMLRPPCNATKACYECAGARALSTPSTQAAAARRVTRVAAHHQEKVVDDGAARGRVAGLSVRVVSEERTRALFDGARHM
jgi:hypothetical protein